jgi:hypothetical protein
MAETWLKCTECKKEIPFGGHHYVCSVSTCKRSKMQLVFCSPVCWDSHLSMVRHREAWAEDAVAPTKAEWERQLAAETDAPREAPRPVVQQTGSGPVGPQIRSVAPAPTPAPRPAAAPVSNAPRPMPTTPTPAAVATRRVVGEASPAASGGNVGAQVEGVRLAEVTDKDVLIVVSKLKKYIKDRSGFNCSDQIIDVLSDHVRVLCDDAIRAAARDERKTVLERDVTRPRR